MPIGKQKKIYKDRKTKRQTERHREIEGQCIRRQIETPGAKKDQQKEKQTDGKADTKTEKH